jgi:hypothetical protein
MKEVGGIGEGLDKLVEGGGVSLVFLRGEKRRRMVREVVGREWEGKKGGGNKVPQVRSRSV